MRQILQKTLEVLRTPAGLLDLVMAITIGMCVVSVAWSVVVSFVLYGERGDVRRRKRSVVDTASMTLFAVMYFLITTSRVGVVRVESAILKTVLIVAGLALFVLGSAVNIAGRSRLGGNWANQVTIYRDQRLVTTGVYRIVRHPLYASLIWMFLGAALMYANIAGLLANVLIFAPLMFYRARQEEVFLSEAFADYEMYRRQVGMFFPRLRPGGRRDNDT